MTPEDVRRMKAATWHARESLARQSMGDAELAYYHLEAGKEFLALVTGSRPKATCADELVVLCLQTADTDNVLLFGGM